MDYRKYSKNLFNKSRCKKCREERKEWNDLDKKPAKGKSFCPFFGLFTKENRFKKPIDVLVVLQGHSGSHSWEGITGPEEQAGGMRSYYRESNIKGNKRKYCTFQTFHCKEIHDLLKKLDEEGMNWVLTDFIHCYVDNDKENSEIAVRYCHHYLKEIIKELRPNNLILVGKKKVQEWYKLHVDADVRAELPDHLPKIINSYFPSKMSANIWVNQGGSGFIIDELVSKNDEERKPIKEKN